MATAFGKFQLLRKIATGGMGEIFLARHEGAKGTQKLLVIKRILPHLLENEGFVGLLRDEARVAAHLNHPNIAKLYEVGEIDGAWYLALEYVDGPDLRRIWHQARATQKPLPLAATCRLIADTAAALHYAHRVRDSSGKALEIVHRDVSPHNILVGMDGQVKLIDFGIARATNRQEETQTGLVRGKYAYMSPEHLTGAVVDARSDIFALGIVLWEALTGRRLFHAETDLLTINIVSLCLVPVPSSINPRIPPALDALCLKALQREPSARFPDADAMRRALESLFAADAEQVGTAELALMMRDLFSAPPVAAELTGPVTGQSRDFVEAFMPLTVAAVPIRSPDQLAVESAASRAGELDPATLDEAAPYDAPLLEPSSAAVRLPVPGSAFVGRANEILRLSSFFLCGGRLVTALGPAGCGKTRLALEYAARSLRAEVPANTGGVLFCPLAEARDVGGICVELARALEIDLTGPDSEAEAQQVGRALAARGEVLLVLDGFENVAKFAPQTVGQWLTLAPKARLLVTSRQMLSLGAELTLELGPFDADAQALITAAGKPGIDPMAAGEILRRAGSLPLALELAAGQTWVSSAQKVAELLSRGSAGSAARPLTAATAADWAFALLPAEEQLALARCSVFKGGFTRAAAAAVLGSGNEVEGLVQKRFLNPVQPSGEPVEERLTLHESVLELCASKLRALGQVAETRARHASHFLALAAAAAAQLDGPDVAAARNRLSRERHNLLAVFRHGLEDRHDGLLLASMVALEPLLSTEGPPALHLSMLETALERAESSTDSLDPSALGQTLIARGRALRSAGRVAEASVDLNQALGLTKQAAGGTLEARVRLEISLGHAARGRTDAAREELERLLAIEPLAATLKARALIALGTLAIDARDIIGAARHLSQAQSITNQSGDAATKAAVHFALHDLHMLGANREAAVAELERALIAFRLARLGAAEGRTLLGLAALYRQRTLPSEALQYFRAGIERLQAAGQTRLVAQGLADLSGMEQEQHRLPRALARCRQALAAASVGEDRRLRGVLLARLGSLLASLKRSEEAKESLAAAQAQLDPLASPALQMLLLVHRAHLEVCLLAGRGSGSEWVDEQRRATLRALLVEAERLSSERPMDRAGAPADPLLDAARSLRTALEQVAAGS